MSREARTPARIEALPDDERCCAEVLRDTGVPAVMLGFNAHCRSHDLPTERQAELWTRELLVQAALGFRAAANAMGRPDMATIAQFEFAARNAWHEADQRRKAGARHG